MAITQMPQSEVPAAPDLEVLLQEAKRRARLRRAATAAAVAALALFAAGLIWLAFGATGPPAQRVPLRSGATAQLAASPSSKFCALDTGLRAQMRAGDGAAGTTYYPIILVNSGSTACVVQGTPGVQPVAGRRHVPVGPSAIVEPSQPGRGGTVTIQPGKVASVFYGVTFALNWPKSTCIPRVSNGVMVHFPGIRPFFVRGFARGESAFVCSALRSTNIDGIAMGQSH